MIKKLKATTVSTATPGKNKKSNNTFALFDVLVSSKGTSNGPLPKSGKNNEINANAARFLEVLTPKLFVYKSKKKKKLSILKKRILLERLKKHIETKLKEQSQKILEPKVNDSVNMSAECLFHVHLFDFVTFDDVEDEDEKGEVVNNVKEILTPFVASMYSLEIVSLEVTHNVNTCYISVAFISLSSAISAVSAINGLVFSGNSIRAVLADNDGVNNEVVHSQRENTTQHDTHETSLITSHASHASDLQSDNTRFVLYLRNMLTASDVCDEEEVHEVLTDLHSLCSSYTSEQSVSRLWIEKKQPSNVSTNYSKFTDESVSDLPWAMLECVSLDSAVRVMSRLHDTVIGGTTVSAHLYDGAAYRSRIFRDCHLLVGTTPNLSCVAVRLVGFVENAQVVSTTGSEEESDEKEEVLSDIASMVSEWCGQDMHLTSVVFAAPPGDTCDPDVMDLMLIVSDVHQAARLSAVMSSKVVGGERLVSEVVVLRGAQHVHGAVYHTVTVDCPSTSSEEPCSPSSSGCLRYHTLHSSGDTSAVVAVRCYFSQEDLSTESEEGGLDDLFAAKRDLLQLARGGDQSDTDREMIISRLSVVTGREGEYDKNEEDEEDEEVVACVEFRSAVSAECVMIGMEGTVVGGRKVVAHISETASELVMQIAPVVMDSIDMTPSIIAIEPALAPSHDVHVRTDSYRPEGYSCLYYEQFSLTHTSAQFVSNNITQPISSNERPGGEGEESADPLTTSTTGTPSKYLAAKEAPKLTMRSSPVGVYKSANEAVNASVKELLGRIAAFQARAKEKNPLQAKQKTRFVSGIKQATSSTKLGKVRLLLLAPNVEESEELDERINALLQEAAAREVPVLYCLSKRLLGKALNMSMKQSVVAVIDPDGAYDLFKLILLFIRSKE